MRRGGFAPIATKEGTLQIGSDGPQADVSSCSILAFADLIEVDHHGAHPPLNPTALFAVSAAGYFRSCAQSDLFAFKAYRAYVVLAEWSTSHRTRTQFTVVPAGRSTSTVSRTSNSGSLCAPRTDTIKKIRSGPGTLSSAISAKARAASARAASNVANSIPISSGKEPLSSVRSK